MATKKLKPVCTPQMFHALENGNTMTTPISVYLVPEACVFRIELPMYLRTANKDNIIQPSVAEAAAEYEQLCEDYSRRILTRDSGKRVLWMGAMLGAPSFTSEVFGVQSLLGLGMQSVRQLPDGSMVDADGVVVGLTGATNAPILLPDAPEVREKIARLAKSIDTAAEIIGGIRTAADPVAYLLSIPESTVDVSVQDGSSVASPKQIELSLEVASDDNRTLTHVYSDSPNPPVEDEDEL